MLSIDFKVNALMEALTYVNRLTGGITAAARLDELKAKHAQQQSELQTMLGPVVALEASLDGLIDPDDERIRFFFDRFDGLEYRFPIDHSPASMLFLSTMHSDFISLEDTMAALKAEGRSKAMLRMLYDFVPAGEWLNLLEVDYERFFDQIDARPVDSGSKWRIMNVCRNFESCLDELCGILRPVVSVIEKNADLYAPLVALCESSYPSVEALKGYISKNLGYTLDPNAVLKAYPYIFGFDFIGLLFESEPDMDSDPGEVFVRAYVGVLKKLIKELDDGPESPTSIPSMLKALSDPNRLDILCFLQDHTEYGRELSARFGLSTTTISQHINKLVSSGLVKRRMKAKRTYYSMDRENVERFIDRLRKLLLGRAEG